MSAKNLLIENQARKDIHKLPSHIKERLKKSLPLIKNNPNTGTRLSGKLKEYYKFRIGDYRIIYRFDLNRSVVRVVKIEHRQGVYK